MAEIDGGQIVNGTITNEDISATANITITKIEQGDRIVKRSGAGNIVNTANMGMNGFQINNMGANTDSAGAITYGQLTSAVAAVNATIDANQVVNLHSGSIVFNEVLSGAVDGTNKVFTLANTPVANKVMVFRSLLQNEGATKDYTISGVTVTFSVAPLVGSEPPHAIYIKA